jgi:hypothetical protein
VIYVPFQVFEFAGFPAIATCFGSVALASLKRNLPLPSRRIKRGSDYGHFRHNCRKDNDLDAVRFSLNFAHIQKAPTLFVRIVCFGQNAAFKSSRYRGNSMLRTSAGLLSEPGLPAVLAPLQMAVFAAIQ